ncbi:type II toxin-antitoxin system RelE/ParE family toxin [Sphingobium sp.]|uniref:type II toxin-antitoxin system RelE/ParE family toxin n=1 Tax=Sphingobium sp. TaxID=1912891 RepID=UPI00262B07E4|nr:type II toxin-antitoxin system RelE/ParE family toxin [Sphingobium sp.]
MKIVWTGKAMSDLVRLHDHLKPVAPDTAARIVQSLVKAPSRLIDYPRIGERLEAYAPREVRRIIIGHYEMRYEIAGGSSS